MRPYLAILRDSFRESLDSKVLWVLLILSTVFLIVISPVWISTKRSTEFHRFHVRDLPGLIRILANESDNEGSPVKHVRGRISKKLKDQMKDVVSKEDENPFRIHEPSQPLVEELNTILKSNDLYLASVWEGTPLTDEAKELLADYENLSIEDRIYANRLLLAATFPSAQFEIPKEEAVLGYAIWTWFDPFRPATAAVGDMDTFVKLSVVFMIQLLMGYGAILTALLVTGSIIPNTFEAGSIDLLLSKPISRISMFLTKFLGGCTFVVLIAAYFVAGLFLVVGVRHGIWFVELFYCLPILLFQFAIYYTISALVGLKWRNSIMCIVLSLMFFGLCWVVEFTYNIYTEGFMEPFRVRALAKADDEIIAVQGGPMTWDADKNEWADMTPDENNVMFTIAQSQSRQAVVGPVYHPESKRLLHISTRNRGGGPMPFRQHALSVNQRQAIWLSKQGAPPPGGTRWLLQSPENEIIAVASVGIFRYEPQKDVLRDASRFPMRGGRRGRFGPPPQNPLAEDKAEPVDNAKEKEGEQVDAKSSDEDPKDDSPAEQAAPFGFGSPAKPLAFEAIGPNMFLASPFAASIHPVSGDIAVYSNKKLIRFARTEEGRYEKTTEQTLEQTPEAAIAYSGSTILIAFGDGKVIAYDHESFEEKRTLTPRRNMTPYMTIASANGQFAAIFHNRELWTWTEGDSRMRRRSSDATAAMFDGTRLLYSVLYGRIISLDIATGESRRLLDPTPGAPQLMYRFGIVPIYTLLPKPSRLASIADYLVLQTDTFDSSGNFSNDELRSRRSTMDIWSSVQSNLLFILVMLGLGSLYVARAEF